jgi:CheY-like chemotaxis protein
MPIAELSFLAVEDHEFQRNVLLRILAGLGATKVLAAVDGAAALKIVKALDPPVDIVISDLDMPGMDGVEFMRHLGEAGIPVSIILASALGSSLLASVEMTTRAYGVRILGVIEKPVTPAKLEALIKLHAPAPPDPNRPRTGTKTAGPSFTFEGIAKALKKKLDQLLRIAQPAAPVDRSVLAAICGGDAAAELEMLAEFRRVNDADAARLKLAVDKRDVPELTLASNRIKDASRTVGAIALAAVCERLERASGTRGPTDWKAIEAHMGAYRRELERLNSCLDSYSENAK